MTGARKWAAWVGVVGLVAGVGCSGGGDTGGSTGAGGNDLVNAPRAADVRHALAPRDLAGARPALGDMIPLATPSVIKTAEVTLRIDAGRLHDSIDDIVRVARDHGGFVLSTSLEETSGRATVTLRVPATDFEAALADAESTGDVTTEEISGRDVGQEFVDLDARLTNFEAQETVLLRLMSRSRSVADTLRVQRELQDVQLEIERLRGRLRYLRNQTDLSTITLTLVETGAPVGRLGTLQRAWHTAADTFGAVVSGSIVVLAVVLPIALLVVAVLLVGRFLWARLPWPRRARSAD